MAMQGPISFRKHLSILYYVAFLILTTSEIFLITRISNSIIINIQYINSAVGVWIVRRQ